MKYGPFNFSAPHIGQWARAWQMVEDGSLEGSLKKILKGLDKK
jgi:hypothetical protein